MKLGYTKQAEEDLKQLAADRGLVKRLKAVRKALGLLEVRGPAYPSLNSHKYDSLRGANGEEVWESYAENQTPAAYRVFWHYGPGAGEITIIAITPHP